MKKYNILFCPIHYVLSDNSGSEFVWSFNIFCYLNSFIKNSIFITGASKNNNKSIINLRIFDTNKINLNLVNVIKFHLVSQSLGLKYVFKSKILFHVLPFSIGSSVNFLFFIPFIGVKKIIGPVQLPLKVLDKDLDVTDARGFKKSNKNVSLLSFLLKTFKPIVRFLNLLMLKKADIVIAISKNVKDALVGMGIDSNKIKIIPVGIDIKSFPIKRETKMNNPFTLISTSYLLKRKNIDQIIKALKMLVDNNYKVRLLIVGDGPQKEDLVSLTKKLNLINHIDFFGFIDNSKIVDYYHKSHCFVSMSASESWGQVYLEAMSCGIPVVASKNDGSEVIIKDGESGFIIPQNDINMLYLKIVELIKSPNKYAALSKNARKIIEKNYDWESVIIPKYIREIENLLF